MVEDFEDIRAYVDADVPAAKARILADNELPRMFAGLKWPNCPGFLKPASYFAVKLYLRRLFGKIKTVRDYQAKVSVEKFLYSICRATSEGYTISGLEHLDPDTAYIFISNHRDITLDVALISATLYENNFPFVEIAFGGNLLVSPVIEDIIRLNRGFIVKRGLPGREQLHASLKLSSYVNKTYDLGHSLWIAQREGRAKDGLDITNPAILKMFHMSQRKKFMSFGDYAKKITIVPISIAYEFDPLDGLKALERYRMSRHGVHNKRPFEDLVSILAGMKRFKGKIHLSYCKPITGRYFESEKELAREIDREICVNYRLFPSNYIAYDIINNCEDHKAHYTDADKDRFLKRFTWMSRTVKQLALDSYAAVLRTRYNEY